jgi:hypothetical protein
MRSVVRSVPVMNEPSRLRNAAEVGAQGPLDENFDGFDFELTQDQMTAIAAMDTRTSVFFDHRDPDQVRRLGTARLDI